MRDRAGGQSSREKGVDPEQMALIRGLRAGTESSYEQLIRLYGHRLLGVVRRLVKDDGAARDCVQETLVQVFRKMDSFDPELPLWPWLRRIAINQSISHLRARKAMDAGDVDHLQPVFDADGCRLNIDPWRIARPDALIEQREVRAAVRKMVDELPDPYRIVLVLRDLEELTTREVSSVLDLSEGAVRVRLHRARAALKKLMEPLLADEES